MQDDLEQLLEQGIASYAEGEPLAGLDERIMARIRLTESPNRRLTGVWAALALLAFGVAGLLLRPTVPRPASILAEAKPTAVAAAPIQTERVRVAKAKRRGNRGTPLPLPKQEVFPSPSPLTREERGLLALVKQDPEGTAQAIASLRKQANEPLEIRPLAIAPLETVGQQ
jgi:hypothetical protein